ncbi:MAG: PilZ domain-containing protein [Myxococcota bacterium]
MAPRKEDKRRFPRVEQSVPVQLRVQTRDREFSARIYTTDISLTGIFFASDFFLKTGTVLDLEFQMPGDDRMVRVRGMIVREVRIDERRPSSKLKSGFGMRFTEYIDDAKTVLASAFLAHKLDGFVAEYLGRRSKKLKTEAAQLRDIIVAWEVTRMGLGLAERELLLGH